MKLKYYEKNEKKIYTLKEEVEGNKTQEAHYKFIKIKNLIKKRNR